MNLTDEDKEMLDNLWAHLIEADRENFDKLIMPYMTALRKKEHIMVVCTSDGDWMAIYRGERLIVQGHSIVVVDLLMKLGFKVHVMEFECEDSFPNDIKDLDIPDEETL